MSHTRISPALRQAVAERSGHRCSYCQTAESITGSLFTVDHIVPESLGGQTALDNLCLACWECNLLKHDRIIATDPETGATVRLFNPNTQAWREHFSWQMVGLLIVGLTSTGRATVNAIRLNRPALVNARRLWIQIGSHPPQD
ncbi:MAG: HNH endonuclease [Anaerolineae bacterium CG2_30_64_16]|nr:MAG: HNH endonuclease [Anaerolineae bacterium CG2_30_64_16]